jgi:hypothetical protein
MLKDVFEVVLVILKEFMKYKNEEKNLKSAKRQHSSSSKKKGEEKDK